MADARHIVDYPALARHRAEVRSNARARLRRLAIAVPAALLLAAGGFAVSAELGLFATAMGAGIVFFTSIAAGSTVDPGDLSGVEGEVSVLKRLQALPDGYALFNRVHLPDPWLPNGRRELDFLVSGPTGLFVVEVKNTPGLVYVRPGERHWPLARRAGCGSRPCWNAIDNPARQAAAQAEALKRWLLMQGISIEPQPVVCLAHPEVAIENAEEAEVPVLTTVQLVEFIDSQPARPAPPALPGALAGLRSHYGALRKS